VLSPCWNRVNSKNTIVTEFVVIIVYESYNYDIFPGVLATTYTRETFKKLVNFNDSSSVTAFGSLTASDRGPDHGNRRMSRLSSNK
jgi:hypothetical protein